MRELLADLKLLLSEVIFPKFCLGCHEEGSYICKNCLLAISKTKRSHCIICKKETAYGLTHEACKNASTPDGLLSLFSYKEAKLGDFIITGKYKFVPEIFEILGRLMTKALDDEIHKKLFSDYIIVPVPLHTSRRLWRGFNQSEVMARIVALNLGMEYSDLLLRDKNTAIQKDLPKNLRIENMHDAFTVKERPDMLKGKNILLIDDVTTTGSTFSSAAKALKKAGVAKVWCLSLASDS